MLICAFSFVTGIEYQLMFPARLVLRYITDYGTDWVINNLSQPLIGGVIVLAAMIVDTFVR